MILQGILLWIGMSVLVIAVGNALFRFSWFDQDTKAVKNAKIYIVLGLSIIVSVSYVLLNKALGIFGLWGINIYPLEDAILSGILISYGADSIYQIYATILSFKEKIQAQKEIAQKTAKALK